MIYSQDSLKLMLVTKRGDIPLPVYVDFIKRCACAGVTSVQLREKNATQAFLLEFAERLQEVLFPLHVPLLINDYVDIAVSVSAAGVHLGQTDGSPDSARNMLGNDKIIGVSIEHLHELDIANNQAHLNYVSASAVFPSKTKNNLKTVWGLEGLSLLCKTSKHPVMAIGGIRHNNLASVFEAGAVGVAVIGAIHDFDDPVEATRALRRVVDMH